MRVLHIGAGNMFGGIETLLVTMARERRLCPELKPHFSVCFENRLSRELRATGAPVDYLGEVRTRNPFTIFRARAALDRLLAQEKIDVAICHGPWAQAMFGAVVRAHKLPLVFWSHGFVSGRHWLEVWARRTKPDLVICNSEATKQNVKLLYPDTPAQVVYCPVSRTAPVIHVEPDEGRPVVIIQVSRMERWKGHTLLLEALSRMNDRPDWVCWIVGEGQTKQERIYEYGLHQLSERLGLSGRVEFHGSREDVPDLLAQSDIFCQPNLAPEPFGIVFIEALQSGVPVVSTRMGGALEIVNETCGVLVPPDDAEQLAETLRGLVMDPEKRHRLGDAGPARAAQLCDPARQLEKLRDVLQALF